MQWGVRECVQSGLCVKENIGTEISTGARCPTSYACFVLLVQRIHCACYNVAARIL
jgi:hypothetical protein